MIRSISLRSVKATDISTNRIGNALFEPDELDFAFCMLPVGEEGQDEP